MRPNKINALLIITIVICLFASSAFSGSRSSGSRLQANSDFRIAEKAYRKAKRDYGQSFDGLPANEKAAACKKIRSALYTNRHAIIDEDIFNQAVLKKQIHKLEKVS